MRRPSAARPGQPRAAPSLIPDVPWILGGTQDATKKLALTRSVPGLRGSPGTPLASKTSESREVFTAGKPIFLAGKDAEGKGGGTRGPACSGGDAQSGQAPLEKKINIKTASGLSKRHEKEVRGMREVPILRVGGRFPAQQDLCRARVHGHLCFSFPGLLPTPLPRLTNCCS